MRAYQLTPLLLVLLCGSAYAQNSTINNTAQLWSEADFAGHIGSRWKWQLDWQYSRQSNYEAANLVDHDSQLTIRSWLHFYPIPTLRLSTFFGVWYNFAIPEVGAREYPEYRGAVQATLY